MDEREFVNLFRHVFRNLKAFRGLYEDSGIDEITGPGGQVLNLHDIERLYDCRHLLSRRQKEAIELFLYHDIREKDVALLMGVSETNPVATYASQGLRRLYSMIVRGELKGFDDLVLKKERGNAHG